MTDKANPRTTPIEQPPTPSSSSSSSSTPPTTSPTAEAKTQAARKVLPNNMRKRSREEEAPTLTQEQIQREVEKRFAKMLEDKNAGEEKQSSEEAIQAGLDRMLAAHSAQSGLLSDPSDLDEADEGGEEPPSRGNGTQRGRGHTSPPPCVCMYNCNIVCTLTYARVVVCVCVRGCRCVDRYGSVCIRLCAYVSIYVCLSHYVCSPQNVWVGVCRCVRV